MKKIIFFLCLFLLASFKSPNNNDVSIIVHFEQILNEYRVSNGLNRIVIDESIKEFTDLRSKNLIHDYSHNQFYKNIYSYNYNFKCSSGWIKRYCFDGTSNGLPPW